jgi:hypothetical protein
LATGITEAELAKQVGKQLAKLLGERCKQLVTLADGIA